MKKIMRNGTFLRDDNGLTSMLRLPSGLIIVAGMEEQIAVLTQDDARLCLGTLSATGEISFETAAKIQKQTEYARLVSGIADVARQVDKFRLPRDYQRSTENFVMCKNGNHGHFKFRGLDPFESLLNPIDSFSFGIEIACDLVMSGKVKPMDAIWALKQIRATRLPIDMQILRGSESGIGNFLGQIFGGDITMEFDLGGGHGLDDLLRNVDGRGYDNPTESQRPTTRPTEQQTEAAESTVATPPPEVTSPKHASTSHVL